MRDREREREGERERNRERERERAPGGGGKDLTSHGGPDHLRFVIISIQKASFGTKRVEKASPGTKTKWKIERQIRELQLELISN